MKFLCRVLCVLFLAVCNARAQQDVDESVEQFTPTLDDDLILYVQKYSVKLGFRGMSGVKSSFGGQGLLSSTTDLGADTGVAARLYHDGYVDLDTRTATDPAGGTAPISPDGRTNNWSFSNDSQATTEATKTSDGQFVGSGFIAMHAYTAQTTDASFHEKDPSSSYGVEISVERDMGKVFGTRLKWGFVGGISINQINSATTADVAATLHTTTDYYSLLGQTAPPAGYIAPQTSGDVDVSILLGSDLLKRDLTTTSATIHDSWKVKGAYMTVRAGPTLTLPITQRFSATLGAGFALVYAGTNFQMDQTFRPETGADITEFVRDGASKILPGFYADANLLFSMNDTSGLYIGAVYQNSGNYTQEISDSAGTTNYSTRIDLSSLQGIRAGVSFKF